VGIGGDHGVEPTIEGHEEKSVPDLASLEKRDRGRQSGVSVDLTAIHEEVLLAAKVASEAKAEDIRVLDMHELVTYTDFMLLCTGRNARLTKHIAQEVAFRVKSASGRLPAGTEGSAEGEWILLDFLDFVVHVFTPAAREFYRLDVLWKQAPVEDIA
jgi:ribosome-associated protein